jgi:hypothetical protein
VTPKSKELEDLLTEGFIIEGFSSVEAKTYNGGGGGCEGTEGYAILLRRKVELRIVTLLYHPKDIYISRIDKVVD